MPKSERRRPSTSPEEFDLVPEAGLGAGVEDVELELVEGGEGGAGLHLADDGERVDLPHGDLGPEAGEFDDELPVGFVNLVVGEAEVVLEPVEEVGLEDLFGAVEGVTGKPDELGTAQAQSANVVELIAQHGCRDAVGQTDLDGAVVDLAGDGRGWKVLPDELQHEQLIEVCVEQRAHDGVELPVVVVGALGEVDVHRCLGWSKGIKRAGSAENNCKGGLTRKATLS